MSQSSSPSKHFFVRDEGGSVRLRLRFDADEASLFEEAAGTTPVIEWIYETLNDVAREQVREARASRAPVPPPLPE